MCLLRLVPLIPSRSDDFPGIVTGRFLEKGGGIRGLGGVVQWKDLREKIVAFRSMILDQCRYITINCLEAILNILDVCKQNQSPTWKFPQCDDLGLRCEASI